MLSADVVTLQLDEPFVIAGDRWESKQVVHVEIRYAGLVGRGEASPYRLPHGESVETVLGFVGDHADILGSDPWAGEEIGQRMAEIPGHASAKAGIDAALFDLQGKLVGLPVYRMLGFPRTGPPSTWTVSLGDPDAMVRKAEKAGDRFHRLKVKLGGRDGLDLERLRAVRGATSLPIQVDVNQGWSYDEALAHLPVLRDLGVEYCEQPLAIGDPNGPRLKRQSPLPLFADEDCNGVEDLLRCAEIAHGVNIKLAKSGGIREAIKTIHAARGLGLSVMVGTMLESGLGVAAACVIAPICDYADLDTAHHLAADPCPGVTLVDGVQVPTDQPGLGVDHHS